MKKLNNIIIPVLLVTLSFSTLAFAKKKNRTEGLSGAGEPCEVLTCMAGKLQGDIQPACQPINQRFFNIRVFTPYYNPPATARTRQGFISTCPGALENRPTLEMVILRYGSSFQE